MKKTGYFVYALLFVASWTLCSCQISEDSGSGNTPGGGIDPLNPGGVPTVTVEITGAVTKSVTVPIVQTAYNGEYDLWVGDTPDFEVRFKWPATPTANQSYSYGSGYDQKILIVDGDKDWGVFQSYTVTLTSIDPASGTITGTVNGSNEAAEKAGPVSFSVAFSGI